MSLDKILRLSNQQDAPKAGAGDDLRELARAVHLALNEAMETGDPAHAVELIRASAVAAEGLSSLLYGDGLEDWVEATAGPADDVVGLAKSDSKPSSSPYGDVTYADPGYQADGKKRYPVDTEEHVRAANSYINMVKNAKAYTAGQLAKIKSKIQSAMKSHGIGANVTASADGSALLALAAMPQQDIPMRHGAFNGTHSHAHMVSMTHEHEHTHVGDSEHSGAVHGSNAGGKSWAAKGMPPRGMNW